MNTVKWRPIKDYDGRYEVSSRGEVRRATGLAMKTFLAGAGYPAVKLSMSGRKRAHYVHHLVATAFIGSVTLGKRRLDWSVNHRDGNKRNNRADNLEYVTQLENHRHAARLGLAARGERSGTARLTESQVREIRQSMESAQVMRKRFDVSLDLIYQIRRRDIWTHVA